MILTIFAFTCFIYTKKTITHPKLIFICLLFMLIGFSHELVIFTLPFFIYIFYKISKKGFIKNTEANTYILVLILISLIIFSFSLIFKPDSSSVNSICQSLVVSLLNQDICQGAIISLLDDPKTVISNVMERFNSYFFTYTKLLVLSLIPLIFTSFMNKRKIILLSLCFAVMSPLFLVAIDWGRWIYIFTFMVFCISLTEKVKIVLSYKKIYLFLGIFYLTTWSIPHCCLDDIPLNQNGLVATIIPYTLRFIYTLGSL